MKKVTEKPVSKQLGERIRKLLAFEFAPDLSRTVPVTNICDNFTCDKTTGKVMRKCICPEIKHVIKTSKIKVTVTKKR